MRKLILIFLLFLTSITFAYAQTQYLWRYREHATDCTSLTDGKPRDLCYEQDDKVFYKCDPSSGDCDTPSEWKKLPDATSTPTANKIPIADSSGKLDGWITLGTSIDSSEITDGTITDADIGSSQDVRKAQIHFDIDGGGSEITTGAKAWVRVPFNMVITGWDITANQSGSIVVDVWKDSYTNFPPTSADSIAGSEKPTLSNQQKNQDTNLTTWTTSVSEGDYIRINVDSASTVTKVAVDIYGYKN